MTWTRGLRASRRATARRYCEFRGGASPYVGAKHLRRPATCSLADISGANLNSNELYLQTSAADTAPAATVSQILTSISLRLDLILTKGLQLQSQTNAASSLLPPRPSPPVHHR